MYALPYPKGESYKVMQGYFGKFSHQDDYAIDFDMPEGTKVCAAREGIVIFIKEDSNIGGKDRKFLNDGNYVLIMHKDGTMANYVHFRFKGVIVKLGQKVKTGQQIGWSGNTGFSSAPHLHLEFRLPYRDKKITFPTKFRTTGNKVQELKAGQVYKN